MSQMSQGSDHQARGEAQLDTMTVIQAQQGDEDAFNRLYLRYFLSIGIFLTHMVGNEEVGRELAQETFLRAWQALDRLQHPAAFLGWLYQIARNIARDYQRHTQSECYVYLNQEHDGIEDTRLAGPEAQAEAADLVRCALTAISPEYRACLILYHVQGLPKTRIAEFLGLKESTVSTYISLGMNQLRTHLLQIDPNFGKDGRDR